MVTLVEQYEIFAGYGFIESVTALLGVGTLKKVIIRGGHHPKMRLKVAPAATLLASGAGPSDEYSFSVSIVHSTSGAVFDVVHSDGVIAARAASTTSAGAIAPFAYSASTNEPVFEAWEDVCIMPQTASGNAAAANLAVLKFEVM